MIAILTAIAAASMRTQRYAGTVRGYSNLIVVEMNGARMRAVASSRWQRIVFDSNTFAIYEAQTTGLGVPTGWDLIETHEAPAHVRVGSIDYATHIAPGGAPAVGTNLPGAIDFSPDGSAMPATVFLSDDRDRDPVRVIVYRATGSSYLKKDW